MSVKIRLTRHGAKKNPFYRIVVAESSSPRDGRFIEIVGTYDPLKDPVAVSIKQDRVLHWIDQGAQPSPTVNSIFKKNGVYQESTAEAAV